MRLVINDAGQAFHEKDYRSITPWVALCMCCGGVPHSNVGGHDQRNAVARATAQPGGFGISTDGLAYCSCCLGRQAPTTESENVCRRCWSNVIEDLEATDHLRREGRRYRVRPIKHGWLGPDCKGRGHPKSSVTAAYPNAVVTGTYPKSAVTGTVGATPPGRGGFGPDQSTSTPTTTSAGEVRS